MELLLVRYVFTDKSTIGKLSVDGIFECYTLEDCVRPAKIQGESAIPAGRYEVLITYSERFKKPMPLLRNVPNFKGVRIHCGNTDKDTEGCILLGDSKFENRIGLSGQAFERLYPRINEALKHGRAFIEIIDQREIPETDTRTA